MKAMQHLYRAESLLKSSNGFGGPVRHRRKNDYRRPYDKPYDQARQKGIYRVRVFHENADRYTRESIPPRRGSITKVDVSFQIMGIVMQENKDLVQVCIQSITEYWADGSKLTESEIARQRPRFPLHSNVGKTVYIQFYETGKKDLIWQRRVRVLHENDRFWGEDEWYLDMPYKTLFEHAWEKELQNIEFEQMVDKTAGELASFL